MTGVATNSDAEELIAFAEELAVDVDAWLRANLPALLD